MSEFRFCSIFSIFWEPMEFDQILHMHLCWVDVGQDYYTSIFTNLQQSYGPWLMSEFHFCSVSWEQIDGIWLNFAYALIFTIARLGLLYINFCKFITELWPLIDVRISFLLNCWELLDGFWPNFAYALLLTTSRLRLVRKSSNCFVGKEPVF